MTTPLSEQLRTILRQVKQRAAARSQAYASCEDGFASRRETIDSTWGTTRQRLQDELASKRTALKDELDQANDDIESRHRKACNDIELEHSSAAQRANEALRVSHTQAEGQFKEHRWTIVTLHEADKKVARDQFVHGQHQLKTNRAAMREAYDRARKLVKSWKCARRLQVSLEPRPNITSTEPWKALEKRGETAANALLRLRSLPLPRLLQGKLVPLAIFLAWILVSLPALVVDPWYLWLVASTATVLPAGFTLHYWMLRRARQQVAFLWQTLAQSVYDAQPLRRLCLERARFVLAEQRRQSRKKHRASLHKTTAQYRQIVKTLETRRQHQLAQAEKKYQAALEQTNQRRQKEVRAVQEKYRAALAQTEVNYERDLRTGEEKHGQQQEENQRRHEREWQELASAWQQACQNFATRLEAVRQQCRESFPSWQEIAESWQPPAELPNGIPFGSVDFVPTDVPHSQPEDPRLTQLDLKEGDNLPALLPFPERSSLLFKAVDKGRDAGIEALQALLLRFWTSLPPGKLRCTILDPVGRGESFAAFMHLADQDESLITSRIWTEVSHIEQRLFDLTTHMETVLQKFLRNKYQTLAEYNAQAGEVAEPFRLLVAAHFPVNFSTQAAQRLISLAGAGARCGIYTLVMVDAKQPMPHGVELADLEAACIVLTWKDGKFLWRDTDFGDLGLHLAQPPDGATCTHILNMAGERAKWANRVEVPFESIAPTPEEMWAADSAGGIVVPLGRTGATARQLLTLGKGTSQHVLIAGKTGSGKSTLLHVLIAQMATRYSPDEIELYLIDFKKGVEFKTYAAHQLPHARVVAVESEREFGLSVLQRLDVELVRRGEVFRTLGVNDLPAYRKSSAKPAPLPRIVLVVDEFQEFFVEDDKIAQEAALLMDRLVRQGRAFGIHIILGSQTLGGAYSLARSTIDQMAVRIALQCSEADAHLILSKENSEARLLSRPGEAIYNSANGMLEGNNLFQIVWLADARRDQLLQTAHDLAVARSWSPRTPLIVFEGSAPADLSKNALLIRSGEWRVASGESQSGIQKSSSLAPGHSPLATRHSPLALSAWLGDAVAIKDPTVALFRRQSGSNLLIIGQNGESAFHIMLASLVSLAAQRKAEWPETNGDAKATAPLATPRAPFSLVIASPLAEDSESLLKQLPDLVSLNVVNQRDLPGLLADLSGELQRRQKENAEGEPLFLFLYGLQRLRELRKGDDDYGFSRKGEDKPVSPAKLFQTLVREGPPLGIFTIIWCDTLTNLNRSIDRQGLREFEMRVLFQMNAGDSSNLLDNPLASKLGPHRAYLYTDDDGKLEKFRPYGLPPLDWLCSFCTAVHATSL